MAVVSGLYVNGRRMRRPTVAGAEPPFPGALALPPVPVVECAVGPPKDSFAMVPEKNGDGVCVRVWWWGGILFRAKA